MTQSFDELFAPKAMSLDELFAAIRPPPLLPVSYPPSDSSADPWASIAASAVNMSQPISPDRLWAGAQPAPLTALNYADPPNYTTGLADPSLPLAAYTRVPAGSAAQPDSNPFGTNSSPSMNSTFSGALNAPRLQNIAARSGPAGITPTTANVNSAGNGVPLKLPDGSFVPDASSPTGYLTSPTADLSSVARAGRLTGENYAWLLRNPNSASGAFNYLVGSLGSHLGHGGSLDYQRDGNFLTGYTHRPQFAHISNFNVGLFAQQAGLTLDEAHRFAGGYASLFSNNADPSKPYGLNKDQYDFIEAGYKAGSSGLYGSAAPSRLQP